MHVSDEQGKGTGGAQQHALLDKFLNEGIKDIIDRYPAVGAILNEHRIGCVPCKVGSCRLKDIVEVHNLPPEAEQAMLTRIAQVVLPNQNVAIPLSKRAQPNKAGGRPLSPPLKMLVDEHVLIKRLLALIPRMIARLDVNTDEGRTLILAAVDFIRSYADRYHHAKEEDILFKFFAEGLDILKVMHADHEQGRGHVRAVVEAVARRDQAAVAAHLGAYRELLTEHIKKEDEVLYPWMDRQLSDSQVGRLFAEFNATDKAYGDAPRTCAAWISRTEEWSQAEPEKNDEGIVHTGQNASDMEKGGLAE
jgi:hemerythrin-like domain-containing protein